MQYRLATSAELIELENLVRLYLQEQWASGDPIVPTVRSNQALMEIARSYLRGSGFGIVVTMVAEDGGELLGFVLAGEHPGRPMFDTTLGKLAQVWAVWVHPVHRRGNHGLGMLTYGRPHLVEMGFETAAMSVRHDNLMGRALTESFGATPAENLFYFPLGEQPKHLERNDG